MAHSRVDRGWRWLLPALCTLSLVLTFAVVVDQFGLGARPWFGWWDSNVVRTGQRYLLAIAQPRADGATAKAGIRDGDLVDLRQQSLEARVAIVSQLMATEPTAVRIRRGSSTFGVPVVGTTTAGNQPLWKIPPVVARLLANLWFVVCAWLIAVRRWQSREARMLALVLLFITGSLLDPGIFVVPWGAFGVMMLVAGRACMAAATVLLVRLSSEFGVRSTSRANLERVAYATILLGFLADLAGAAGLATNRIDPLPFSFRISTARGALDIVADVLVVAAAAFAIRTTAPSDRPRAAWILLPLPVVLLTAACTDAAAVVIHSWFANIAAIGFSGALRLLGALIVTYALLKRRVLDIEFVASRTLVVATVSLIVVATFVLLEWILGTFFAGVSHATGLIANGAVALGLGLSLNVIHKRVDAMIDQVLFRKRYADERALLDFAQEAAFVTRPDALLDQAIENLERHTDARSAAILLDGGGTYSAVRSFGKNVAHAVDENDAVIVALKTWHKPIDPHRYPGRLQAALAFPMLWRARLLGVLALGERAGGEAYAPDEIEALSAFAHGVAAALEGISPKTDGSIATLEASIAALTAAVAELPKKLAAELNAE